MTFSDLIALWPSTAEFGRDVGISVDKASKWRRGERGIPSSYWPAVLAAAKKRKLRVSAQSLMDAEQRFKTEGRAA